MEIPSDCDAKTVQDRFWRLFVPLHSSFNEDGIRRVTNDRDECLRIIERLEAKKRTIEEADRAEAKRKADEEKAAEAKRMKLARLSMSKDERQSRREMVLETFNEKLEQELKAAKQNIQTKDEIFELTERNVELENARRPKLFAVPAECPFKIFGIPYLSPLKVIHKRFRILHRALPRADHLEGPNLARLLDQRDECMKYLEYTVRKAKLEQRFDAEGALSRLDTERTAHAETQKLLDEARKDITILEIYKATHENLPPIIERRLYEERDEHTEAIRVLKEENEARLSALKEENEAKLNVLRDELAHTLEGRDAHSKALDTVKESSALLDDDLEDTQMVCDEQTQPPADVQAKIQAFIASRLEPCAADEGGFLATREINSAYVAEFGDISDRLFERTLRRLVGEAFSHHPGFAYTRSRINGEKSRGYTGLRLKDDGMSCL